MEPLLSDMLWDDPLVYGYSVYLSLTVFVCGFAGVTSGLGGTVVFLVELNKQFCP